MQNVTMVAKMHFCYNCGKATMCFLFCKKEMFAKCTLNIFLCKMYAKHFPLENVRQNRFLHCRAQHQRHFCIKSILAQKIKKNTALPLIKYVKIKFSKIYRVNPSKLLKKTK